MPSSGDQLTAYSYHNQWHWQPKKHYTDGANPEQAFYYCCKCTLDTLDCSNAMSIYFI